MLFESFPLLNRICCAFHYADDDRIYVFHLRSVLFTSGMWMVIMSLHVTMLLVEYV